MPVDLLEGLDLLVNLFLNAGAFGGQTWENVTQVEYCLPDGTLEVLERDQFKARYREITSPKPGWFCHLSPGLPGVSPSVPC